MLEPLYISLGARIVTLRKSAGMTQADLAKALGLTRTSVANVEAGRQRILLHTLYDIAAALRTDPDQLLPPVNHPLERILDKLSPEERLLLERFLRREASA